MLKILFVFLALGAPSPSPSHIRRIGVDGNQRVPSISILREIDSRPGFPLDDSRLQNNVKKLYRMGYIGQVQADSAPAA